MDILTYINKMNRLYGNEPTPVRYNTQQYLQGGRVGYQDGKDVNSLIASNIEKVDFKTKSMDELMAKVKELSKDPKYKTVKDIERELFKFFDQEKYTRRQGPEFLFFDKEGKNFSFPRNYSIGDFTIGKKKLAERQTILRQIIGTNMFKYNPNHKNAAALLTKFYRQDPSTPTFKPTTTERNIMAKFLRNFSLQQPRRGGLTGSFF